MSQPNPQKQQQLDAAEVKLTLQTKGWEILEGFLNKSRGSFIKQLIEEDDETVKSALQGKIRGIDALLKLAEGFRAVDTSK